MDVGVDETRKNHEIAEMSRSADASRSIVDVHDDAVIDVNGSRPDAVGQRDPSTAYGQAPAHVRYERVALFRNEPLPGRPTNAPFSMTTRPRDSTVSAAPVPCRPSYGL